MKLELYSAIKLSMSCEIETCGYETVGWLLYIAHMKFNIFGIALHMTTNMPGRSNPFSAYNNHNMATVSNLAKPVQEFLTDNDTVLFHINLRGGPETPNNLLGKHKNQLVKNEYNRVERERDTE